MKVSSLAISIGIDYKASVSGSGSMALIGYLALVRKRARLEKEVEKNDKFIYIYQIKL